MNISERIKKLRKILGLTQKEFANRLGITPRGLQKWESGEYGIKETALRFIESTFSVSPQWLREGKGDMLSLAEAQQKTLADLGIKRMTDIPELQIPAYVERYLDPEHMQEEHGKQEDLIVAIFRTLSLEGKIEILKCMNRMRIVEELETKPTKNKKRA